jgi:hypothetical protein
MRSAFLRSRLAAPRFGGALNFSSAAEGEIFKQGGVSHKLAVKLFNKVQ